MAEDDDVYEEDYPLMSDEVAERAIAFAYLVTRLETIEDAQLRELGANMLQAMIRSIRTPPAGDLKKL